MKTSSIQPGACSPQPSNVGTEPAFLSPPLPLAATDPLHPNHSRQAATYQMYPAWPNDKIINLLRLADSLVRQRLEFPLSWDQSLFLSLPRSVCVLHRTPMFGAL